VSLSGLIHCTIWLCMFLALCDYTFLMCLLVGSDTRPGMIIYSWLEYYDWYDTRVGFKFCERTWYKIEVPWEDRYLYYDHVGHVYALVCSCIVVSCHVINSLRWLVIISIYCIAWTGHVILHVHGSCVLIFHLFLVLLSTTNLLAADPRPQLRDIWF